MATIERKAASTLPNLILPIVGTDQVVMFRNGVVLGRSTVENILASITGLYAQANGIATLDGFGKVPTTQIPDTVLGAVDYKGAWNATTNSPNLGASAPDKGDYYVVATAGSTSLGGIADWKLGDWAIFNGSAWEKVDNTDAVVSVFGRVGVVVPQAGDYNAGQVSYDPTASGMAATQLQAAVDELKAALGSGGSVNIQEFTSSGTWNKPSGVTSSSRTWVRQCGGGGGGGGGFAAIGGGHSGGGGGGGAAIAEGIFQTSTLGATESVTCGAGGTGGAAAPPASIAAGDGGGGGTTTFGSWLSAYGGGGGSRAQANQAAGAGGGAGRWGSGGNVSNSLTNGTAGTGGGAAGNASNTNPEMGSGGGQSSNSGNAFAGTTSYGGGPGGGGGGGRNGTGPVAYTGGGGVNPVTGAVGSATAISTNGANGVAVAGSITGTSGAGGGGNATNGTAGNGGAGSYGAGGGGAGSAHNNTGSGGAGGAGGGGRCVAITFI